MSRRFDPRLLVGPPFKPCPKCGAEEFGVFSVGSDSYSRKCRACWHGDQYALWPLSRKVVYIDQFAISNMMKALNRESPRHAAAAANPFWVTLFERLDRLVKLQLIICPDSDLHRHESMVSGFFEPLKRMYEQLSRGVTFEETHTIAQRQLYIALAAWLKNETPRYDFNPKRVTHGGINDWKESFIISVNAQYPDSVVQGIRTFRDEVHVKIKSLFHEELRTSTNKDFKYWLDREGKAGGRAVLQSQRDYLQRMREMVAGTVPFTFDNVYTSQGLDQYNLIVEVLQQNGTREGEMPKRLADFLLSDAFKNYPSSRISSLVWAAIGQAAAGGQKEPPNAGMGNDISVLTLLPYCDAMFVDNGCCALWEKVPRKYRPSYTAKPLFSYNTRDEFLAYLDDIEAKGDPAVVACAREVYGEPKPFLTMYEDRRERRRKQ